MVDFITIEAGIEPIRSTNLINSFKWKGLLFDPVISKGNLKCFKSDYNGMRVILRYDKIEVSNSIHKFYKGNNYTDFSLSELKTAIDILCQRFEIQSKNWVIKKLEFGVNITTPQPAKNYLDLFLEYKNREFEKMKAKHIYYGRKCYLSEYALKVYDKSLQTKRSDNITLSDYILRVEFCYNQKRKLPQQVKTLRDLLDKDRIKDLFIDFNEAFNKVIVSDEVDFINSTDEERMLFYASLNPQYIKVEEQLNKTGAKAIKPKIKQLKERFFKREFKQWFLNSLHNKYIELYCN